MRKPKLESAEEMAARMPYASTTASFFGDQAGAQGNSFLGRMFQNKRKQQTNSMVKPTPAPTIFNRPPQEERSRRSDNE